jgi:hypothetical protein
VHLQALHGCLSHRELLGDGLGLKVDQQGQLVEGCVGLQEAHQHLVVVALHVDFQHVGPAQLLRYLLFRAVICVTVCYSETMQQCNNVTMQQWM